jgi:hypothetical protein
VVTWFPIIVLLGFVVLVLLHISGTSSGVEWYAMGHGVDPRLVLGTPRAIRSDEWLVQQSWVVSQAAHGYPPINPSLPGGLDMAVLNELPSWDWSTIFRPHLWGYLLFGLDAGIAWFWWLPAFALVSGCYVFVVSVLPRRPFVAVALSVTTFFAPLLQWWYTPSSVWPVAWAFLAMAGVVWTLRDGRRWVRIFWAAIVGYSAVTMAMGLYFPFMLPAIFVALIFAVGYLFRVKPWQSLRARAVLAVFTPLFVAAVSSVVIVLAWVAAHLSTFEAINSTVYPGERTIPTGTILLTDPYLTRIAGAPWAQALKSGVPSLLGGNSSEGSTVFLLAFFLLPGLLWVAIKSFGRSRKTDWLVVICLLGLLFVLAYLFIPGWDGIAHLLFLDRVAPERFRMYFVPALVVFAVLAMDYVDTSPVRRTWIKGLASAALATVCFAVLAVRFAVSDPAVLRLAPTWIVVGVAFIAVTFLFFTRKYAGLAAGVLVAATLLTTVNVNPLYRGIYDLRTTEIGQKVQSINRATSGTWVGVGTYSTMATLMETGVPSFSGVQTYPPKKLWHEVDPTGKFKKVWDRLAHIDWYFGKGGPAMTNPTPDVALIRFDACSAFAQAHVTYVLADTGKPSGSCTQQLAHVVQGTRDMTIYRVVPKSR